MKTLFKAIIRNITGVFKHECCYKRSDLVRSNILTQYSKFTNELGEEALCCYKCGKEFYHE